MYRYREKALSKRLLKNAYAMLKNYIFAGLLQLLVFQLAFKLLGFGHFTNGFVEIILIDGLSVVFDGKQST